MKDTALAAVCAGMALIEFLSLRACFQAVVPPKEPEVLSFDNSVIALADGSVMTADPGTISRNIIDWFNDKSARPSQFDIGAQPFMPNSAVPAPEVEVRLDRFAIELNANPDVNATINVCGSGNSAGDQELAVSRARRLKEELLAKQIDPSRISTETCRASSPPASAPPGQQQGQIISITLSRGG